MNSNDQNGTCETRDGSRRASILTDEARHMRPSRVSASGQTFGGIYPCLRQQPDSFASVVAGKPRQMNSFAPTAGRTSKRTRTTAMNAGMAERLEGGARGYISHGPAVVAGPPRPLKAASPSGGVPLLGAGPGGPARAKVSPAAAKTPCRRPIKELRHELLLVWLRSAS